LQAEKVNKLFKIKALAAVTNTANSLGGVAGYQPWRDNRQSRLPVPAPPLTIENAAISQIVGTHRK
jgi:hypothetical protein